MVLAGSNDVTPMLQPKDFEPVETTQEKEEEEPEVQPTPKSQRDIRW